MGIHADWTSSCPVGQRVVLPKEGTQNKFEGTRRQEMRGWLVALETAQPCICLLESVSGKVPVN